MVQTGHESLKVTTVNRDWIYDKQVIECYGMK